MPTDPTPDLALLDAALASDLHDFLDTRPADLARYLIGHEGLAPLQATEIIYTLLVLHRSVRGHDPRVTAAELTLAQQTASLTAAGFTDAVPLARDAVDARGRDS